MVEHLSQQLLEKKIKVRCTATEGKQVHQHNKF